MNNNYLNLDDFDKEDLVEAEELISRLGELGIPTLPDDAITALHNEIQRR